jgi:hypothetical protein
MNATVDSILGFVGFIPIMLLHMVDRVMFWILYLRYGKDILPFDARDRSRWYTVKAKPVNPDQDLSNAKETSPYRNAKYMDKLLETPVEGVKSLCGLMNWIVDKYGDKKAMGKRILKTIERRRVGKGNKSKQQSSSHGEDSSKDERKKKEVTSERNEKQEETKEIKRESSSNSDDKREDEKVKYWEIAHFSDKIEWISYRELGQKNRQYCKGTETIYQAGKEREINVFRGYMHRVDAYGSWLLQV